MMTHEDFYAKTLVAQVKACKRFGFQEDLIYNALDTLEQARKQGIITLHESNLTLDVISDYLFNMHIPSVFVR